MRKKKKLSVNKIKKFNIFGKKKKKEMAETIIIHMG